MHWESTCSIESEAPVERVWAALADGARWPVWNERFEWMWLEGPLARGTLATLKPRRYRQTAFVVEAVEEGRRLAFAASFGPVAQVRVAFDLAPSASGTRITHRTSVDGILGGLALRLMAKRFANDAPVAIAGLARYAATEKEKAR